VLSFSLIGALWTCSSGFSAMIDALNVAYDVPETRTLWKTRLLTLELTFLVGTLIVVAFAAMIVGPQFGEFLAGHMGFTWEFAHLWPFCRYVLSALFIILAVECVYFLAPNIKQRFLASLPGATLAVVGWLVLSDCLSVYFRRLAHLNRTYGTVGGVIALLVWLYWTGFMVLLGADINARILKRRGRELEIKQPVQGTEAVEAPPHSDPMPPEVETAQPPSKTLPPSN
jgi:membrane protein